MMSYLERSSEFAFGILFFVIFNTNCFADNGSSNPEYSEQKKITAENIEERQSSQSIYFTIFSAYLREQTSVPIIIGSKNCIFRTADNPLTFAEVDNATYQFFEAKQWTQLITKGKQALGNHIDYFYLRMRIGIAYYELKKPIAAIRHFEKAMEFNSSDATAMEYLYYSYLFAGKEADARLLSKRFTKELTDKLHVKENKFIDNIYMEAGPSFSDNNSTNGKIAIAGNANIYGETDRSNNMTYLHAGIKNTIGKSLSFYEGYSNISIAKTKQISIDNQELTNDYSLSQNDYYINANIQPTKGLTITPALHVIHVSSALFHAVYNNVDSKYSLERKDTAFNNYVVSLALEKDMRRLNYSVFGTYSNLNGQQQIQTGLTLSYFPLGNLNLYGASSGVVFFEDNKNRLIFDQSLGVKVFPKMWIEANGTMGELKNYNEKNAFIVYNIPDELKYKYGVSVILPLFQHIEFSVRYQYLQKENSYISYQTVQDFLTFKTNYQYQTIIGGLKWKL